MQVADFYGDPQLRLTEQQAAQATQLAIDAGVPESFTIFAGTHTLAEGTPSMTLLGHASNGTGVDHIFDAYAAQLVGALCTVAPDNVMCQV